MEKTMAASTYFDAVQKVYIAFYQRPADPAGLYYWAQRVDAAGGDMTAVINAFATSEEAGRLYGPIDSTTIGTVIDNVYQALFNRDPDAEGKQFYVDGFTQGTFTAGTIVLDILNGAKNSDAVAIQNKLEAANLFTQALDPEQDGIGPFTATYAGADDEVASRAWLGSITADPATRKTQSDVIADIQANIANPGDPILGQASGQTFTLTAGADLITGTAGNDTINALTIKADGTAATTLSAFDSIDGGAGIDTLNIYNDNTNNKSLPASASIKNVENINIYNDGGAFHTGTAGTIDASKFVGVTNLLQATRAADVTNLAAATTATFKGQNTTAAADLSVTAASGVASAKVALDGVKGTDADADGTFDAGDNTAHLTVAGDALSSVTVSGTLAQAVVSTAAEAAANLNLNVAAGKDVETLSVNSAVATKLSITDGAGTKKVTTIDASASTGAITYADSETTVAAITTGSGKDDVTVVTATSKTAGSVVNASVTTNAGDDKVTVKVTGDGNTTVNTGAGNDTVHIQSRDTSVLTVNLGDGADTFTSDVAIAATDSIDAGAGSDTLLLSLVGAANVGAFKNFDVYDVKGMTANLDLDILNTNNAVTEIVGSGALGAAVTLQNVGAGVNFRATADMGLTNALTLTQKTAGALTVTLDADQATDVTGDDVAQVSVAAAGATSISAVFDAAYDGVAGAGTAGSETAATDNVSTIALATQAAASINVVSGGANAKNVLNVTEGTGTDALTTVTVTGAQALTLSVNGASKLATIDASAATGGLTAALADLKDGGTIKLGSGTDVITATNTSNATGAESIQGFAKTAAVAVSDAAADATAKAAAIAAADKIVVDLGANEAVANANGAATGATLANGVLTFTGAGPATLDAALVIADAFAETAGEVVAFQYLGDTYIFGQGATHDNGGGAQGVSAADLVVKLVGVTGVTNLVETGTDHFFIV